MKDHILKGSVSWSDGTHDSSRSCSECGLSTCKYPVHRDYYRVLSNKEARAFDAQSLGNDDDYSTQVI